MPLRLPPLATLRIFEAAARLQSFKLAADELGVTPSAVSHGIRSLEKWLRVALFRRHGPNLVLEAAARQLLPYVAEGLSTVALGAQRVARADRAAPVSITAAPTFAARWLLPRLHRFRKRHPRIGIAIDTSHRSALFPLDGVDLAIRMGAGLWPGLRADLLFRESLVPIATPDYLRGVKAKRGAIEWAQATLLRVTSVEHDWDTWLEQAGVELKEPKPSLNFDMVALAMDAAALGLGVAIGRQPLVADDLASGRLVRAGHETGIVTGYWLVAPPGDDPRGEIRAFRHWILQEAGTAAPPAR